MTEIYIVTSGNCLQRMALLNDVINGARRIRDEKTFSSKRYGAGRHRLYHH